jgi:DNA-binding NarL/FixJ family response regulator
MQPRILVVDDHEIVREGIRTLLTTLRPAWRICGEAGDAKQGIQSASVLKPDLIILDVTMPGMSGLEAVPHITASCPDCRVLIFTMHESATMDAQVRESGAHGYVLKSQAARDLIRAIDTLLSGGTFFGVPVQKEKKRSAAAAPESGPLLRRLRFA